VFSDVYFIVSAKYTRRLRRANALPLML